jgi:hypothetical protein
VRLTRAVAVACLVALAWPARAGAEPALVPVALLGEDGGCPSPAQVGAALTATLPSLRVVVGVAEPAAFVVHLVDAGDALVVDLPDGARRFDDAARDCASRARKAAVFISLVVPPAPPAPAIAAPAAPATPVTAVPIPPPARGREPLAMRFDLAQLEVGGMLAAAPGRGAAGVTGGGAVRLFFGSWIVGAVLGVSGLAPERLPLHQVAARITREPFEVGLRLRAPLRRLVFSIDATLVLAAYVVRGLEVSPAATSSRIEFGLALTGRVEYWAWRRLAPFLQFGVTGVPSGYDFSAPGLARVGSSPQAWLTTELGVAVKLR